MQYILDLNDNRFSDAVIRQFIGNVCALSVQKFSSNVIEKVLFADYINAPYSQTMDDSVFVLLNTTHGKFSSKNFSTAQGSRSYFAILMAITVYRSGGYRILSSYNLYSCKIRRLSTTRSLVNVRYLWTVSGLCSR